jgi:hypothetical protein
VGGTQRLGSPAAVVTIDAPGGGEHCARIMENDSGCGTRVAAISNETTA